METLVLPQKESQIEALQAQIAKLQLQLVGQLYNTELTFTKPIMLYSSESNPKKEDICMIGSVRGKGKCGKCGGKWATTTKGIGCPQCFTMPEKYIVDFHWKGKRIRLFKDKSGETLDSYNRAKRLLERIRGEIDDHTFDPTFYVKADQIKYQFEVYIWNWVELIKSDWPAPATEKKNTYLISKYLVPFFGKLDLREIRSAQIVKFYKYLNDLKLSSNYKHQIMAVLHKLFTSAWRWEDIAKIPIFPQIKTEEKPFKWIDKQDQEKILLGIKDHDKLIFKFLFLCGCRISEITALKWDCVDYKNRILTIKRTHSARILKEATKTNDWRFLYITDEMMKILKDQPRTINGYVFTNKHGEHYHYSWLHQIWGMATKKVGIQITLYNAVKHSWACQRIKAGFHHEEIALAFGHKNINMTKKYTRILTENLKEVFEGEKIRHIKTVTKPSPGGLGEQT